MQEYNIKFEEARQTEVYKFRTYDDNKKGTDGLKDFMGTKKMKYKKGSVISILEFGHIDIELLLCGYTPFDLGLYVCSESEKGWNDSEVVKCDSTEISTAVKKGNFEEYMFNKLLEFAKERKLLWSRLNGQ